MRLFLFFTILSFSVDTLGEILFGFSPYKVVKHYDLDPPYISASIAMNRRNDGFFEMVLDRKPISINQALHRQFKHIDLIDYDISVSSLEHKNIVITIPCYQLLNDDYKKSGSIIYTIDRDRNVSFSAKGCIKKEVDWRLVKRFDAIDISYPYCEKLVKFEEALELLLDVEEHSIDSHPTHFRT